MLGSAIWAAMCVSLVIGPMYFREHELLRVIAIQCVPEYLIAPKLGICLVRSLNQNHRRVLAILIFSSELEVPNPRDVHPMVVNFQ